MGVTIIGGQEHCFHTGQVAVHDGHGCFILVIDGGSKPLDDRIGAVQLAKVGEQTFTHRLNADATQAPDGFPNHFETFFGFETVFLDIVGRYRHDDLVKEVAGTGNDLNMTIVDGVKGPGADGSAHTLQSINPAMGTVASHGLMTQRVAFPLVAHGAGS